MSYEEKLQKAKEMLGEKYLLHPTNQVKKKRVKLSPFQKLVKKVTQNG